MKFKCVIMWIVVVLAACVALHHIRISIQSQLDQASAKHQHALEESADVR